MQFIQDTGWTGNAGTSPQPAPSITVAAGHSLLIAVMGGGANPTVAGNGNTYVQAGASLTDTFGTFLTLFYVLAANPGATVVTATDPVNLHDIYVAEYSGLAAFINSSLVFVNGASVGANTIASGTIPISGPSLLWGFCSEIGAETLTAGTAPNAFTARGASAIFAKLASEDALVSANAAATFGCTTGSNQYFVGALAFTLAPAGAVLAGAASDATTAAGALTTGAASFAQILLDNPNHAGGSTQINMGSGPGTGTGDTAQVAFTKIKQDFADLNAMLAQIYGRFVNALFVPPSGDTTGATDTANLIAAINQAASTARSIPGASDPVSTSELRFAAGTYTINLAGALMNAATLTAKLQGLRLTGAGGEGQTTFLYAPGTAGPMLTNQRWLGLTFIDISFRCTVAGCDFMQSQEQGGLTSVQSYKFVRCTWNGFQNDFMLTGANNNSEMYWDGCTFGVTGSNVLYVPPAGTATITAGNASLAIQNSPEAFPLGATVAFTATLGNIAANTNYFIVAATTTTIQISATANGAALVPSVSGSLSGSAASDQFLNYTFHNCKYDPGSSNASWVNMSKGGHVVFSGFTDISGWQPTVDTYLIQLLGTSHAQGVCSFLVEEMRIEHKSDHALLFHCQWPSGSVKWGSLDPSSQVSARTNTAIPYVLVEMVNVEGPSIEWANSSFLGTHVYAYATNNFSMQSRISYKNCDILQQPNAASFCTFTALGTNAGGAPLVDFDIGCRGTDPTEIFASTLNWHLSASGVTQGKVVNFVGANADAPPSGGTVLRKLPKMGLLKSSTFNVQPSAQTGAYDFTLQTTEAVPTVLARFTGANAGAAASPATVPLNFWMTNDQQRTLQLVDTLAGGRTSAFRNYVCTASYDG
jgi:hypothetical protein